MTPDIPARSNCTRRLEHKLVAYAIGGAALVTAEARAGIVHTDLGPMGIRIRGTEFEPGIFDLDLNDDGAADFRLLHAAFESVSGYYSSSNITIRVTAEPGVRLVFP